MILEKTIEYLLQEDSSQEFQSAINSLCKKYSKLEQWKKEVDIQPSSIVLDSCDIALSAALDADYYQYNQDFRVAGMVTKLMLKSLKIAQGILALMLIKSPLKVAVAYNALHWVIQSIEKKENIVEEKKHPKKKKTVKK
jgi:hypothetical protein